MRQLAAPAHWQPEVRIASAGLVSLAEAEELLGDEMNDLALALDATVDRHDRCYERDLSRVLKELRPDNHIGDTILFLDHQEEAPSTEPGRWRTRTRPVAVSKRPSRADIASAHVTVRRLANS